MPREDAEVHQDPKNTADLQAVAQAMGMFEWFQIITAALMWLQMAQALPVGQSIESPVPVFLTYQGKVYDIRIKGTRLS